MTSNNEVVAIYKSRAETEAAVKELQQSGFDMKKLSIVGRDHHMSDHLVAYHNTGNRMKHWGKMGVSWGGIGGLLFGSGLFLVPGADPLFVAGPLVGRIVGALEGAEIVGSLSALGAGLYSISAPRNSAPHYEATLKFGKFVVVAHSSAEEATRARNIINRAGPEVSEERPMSFANEERDIAGAVVVGVGGLKTLGTGLCSLGVPEDSVRQYETALQSGKFVIIAHGYREETTRARNIIKRTNPETVEEHQPYVNRQPNLMAI
jgi:hypothetical protein